jgi:hypothetical protein
MLEVLGSLNRMLKAARNRGSALALLDLLEQIRAL